MEYQLQEDLGLREKVYFLRRVYPRTCQEQTGMTWLRWNQ